jgi:hypothetical protein
MTIEERPQMKLGQKFIEDQQLEQLLEEREAVKEAKKGAADEFAEVDERCRKHLETAGHDIPVGEERRVGRFIIAHTMREATPVEFTRKGGAKINIRLSKD